MLPNFGNKFYSINGIVNFKKFNSHYNSLLYGAQDQPKLVVMKCSTKFYALFVRVSHSAKRLFLFPAHESDHGLQEA